MTPEAVIFDIGNVLIGWDPTRFYDRVIGHARRVAMFAAVDLETMNKRMDLGEDFATLITATADAYPAFRDEILMWHDRWIEIAQPEITHSVCLLRALRSKGVPVFALSNFGIGNFEIAVANYPFLDEFDRRYISGCMGVIKPDPEIYRRLEKGCDIAPARLLFTDDRADNIAAADARGWQTHLFDGARGWADRLVLAGLLSADEAAP